MNNENQSVSGAIVPFLGRRSIEGPLRSEILGSEGLSDLAKVLARQHQVILSRRGTITLYERFEENDKVLQDTYEKLFAAAHDKEALTSGAEWLLDNYHVVKEQVLDIYRDFPRGYYHTLPKLVGGPFAHFPRVYHLILEFLSHTDAALDSQLLTLFVDAYQSVVELSSGELWAVPIMLRFGLIENLRRLALSDAETKERQVLAEALVESVVGEEENSGTDIMLSLAKALADHPGALEPGAPSLMRRLRELGPRSALTLQWIEERLREQGHDPEEISRLEQNAQAANQISIGNSVASLREVGTIDWKRWFESVSLVHRSLLEDPAHIYGRCDFVTRDLYRHRIEGLARKLKRSEHQISRDVVALARDAEVPPDENKDQEAREQRERLRHVGYYLVGRGRATCEQVLGFQAGIILRIRRGLKAQAVVVYVGSIVALTALFLYIVLLYAGGSALEVLSVPLGGAVGATLLALLLAAIPLSSLSTDIVQWIETHWRGPSPLPKLDFDTHIPDACRTVVAVQLIFQDSSAVDRAVEALEVQMLANDDPQILYALLADLGDASAESVPGDEAIVSRAVDLISQLNSRHFPDSEGRFFLLFRRRLWNASERKFMGWERKRGKVSEFNRLILGDDTTSLNLLVGEKEHLRGIKYIITLDSDSRLPRGVARKLIGAMEHPLNRPVFDEQKGIVTQGYAIIQPRVGVVLPSAHASRFASFFAGHAGLDPYTLMVADLYQDLFEEGSYLGKGIYDVRAFEKALHNRVPENALLSHDLFEGCFARVALASDIEILDNFPSHYYSYAKRMHRWVRGDWQLLPWIAGRIPNAERTKNRSPLSALGRWKLLDNLRRSLVPPSCFALLVLAVTVVPGSPLPWIFVVLAVLSFPIAAEFANALAGISRKVPVRAYARAALRRVQKQALRVLFTISFLPYKATLLAHAILQTLYRLYVSKVHLLEWESADTIERRTSSGSVSVIKQMGAGLAAVLLVLLLVAVVAPERSPYLLPFLVLWTAAPAMARWLSGSAESADQKLTSNDRDYLREVAWKTWKFFDDLMNEENNFLIPDNIQVAPDRIVAKRTSPTNIGVSILSVISAYDLGFEPLPGVVERLEKTFNTLGKLQRFHGHFLNWYDTQSLAPLAPRYISFVDSGNLVGHLFAARTAFLELPVMPLVTAAHWEHVRQHLLALTKHEASTHAEFLKLTRDLYDQLAHPCLDVASLAKSLKALKTFDVEVERLGSPELFLNASHLAAFAETREIVRTFLRLEPAIGWYYSLEHSNASRDPSFLRDARGLTKRGEILERIMQLAHEGVPSLYQLKQMLESIEALLEQPGIETNDASSLENREELLDQISLRVREGLSFIESRWESAESLARQAQEIIQKVNLAFLYDTEQGLFRIGYHIDDGRRDKSAYDLLASESRLGSFVAIAKGEVPQKHWFALGRSLVDSPGGGALISWSGTMFEYLMPQIVMREAPGTLLAETCRAVVKTQREYGQAHSIPWGVSESAYSGVDLEKTYQYRAFGVPSLGLKRGLADDMVVSPYSSALALMVDPLSALRNLRVLERQGMRGEYGFYESIDYTPARLSAEESSHKVETFFSHHQGMSLVAINNTLHQGVMQRRFHADPWVRATELLLHERFPDSAQIVKPQHSDVAPTVETPDLRTTKAEQFFSPHLQTPRTRVLSNGHYTVMVDNSGNGFSSFDSETALTRWREDAVAGQSGTYIFIRDLDDGKLWSVAYQPTRVEPEAYEVIFNQDKIEFKRRDFGIFLHTEITVSPEDNVEIRKVSVTNLSTRRRNLEITSYAEVALADRRADLAHPVFSKMFIESEYNEDFEGLIFSRRPRSKSEGRLYLMHLLTMKTVWQPTQYESSRFEFLGRGNRVNAPKVFESERPLSGSIGAVLDPVFSLRARVELEEGQTESAVFVTGFAKSKEEIVMLGQRYRDSHAVTRAFEMAWSQSNIELRYEQVSIRQIHAFQRLAAAIFYNVESLRGSKVALSSNALTQSGLWRFGVSGDLPIVLLRVDEPSHLRVAHELLLAHQYLRFRGIGFDLIIVNEYPGGYLQAFQDELEFVARAGHAGSGADRKGGVYLRTRAQLSSQEIGLIEAVARVVLWGIKGPLSVQLRLGDKEKELPVRSPVAEVEPTIFSEQPKVEESVQLEFFNGQGGFIDKGKAYQIELTKGGVPPLPWSNVVANPHFGFLATEAGGGYTWSENSRENKLTPWSNDPVSDPCSEVVFIRDEEHDELWSATPRPIVPSGKARVRHRFGSTQFLLTEHGIESRLTLSGSPTERVKWWHLELTNHTLEERRLEIYLLVEWTLGISREESVRHVVTGYDVKGDFVHATNKYNNEFAGRVVSLGSNLKLSSFTTSRQEFLGQHGLHSSPGFFKASEAGALASLLPPIKSKKNLSGRVGAGFDSCGVLKVEVIIEPGASGEVLFFLNEAASLDEARRLAPRHRSPAYRFTELGKVEHYWNTTLGAVQVRTPDRAFDILMNGWLLYQTLSCRIYGRSAFYQSGGAIGFRDQLQDVLSLLYSRKDIARAQILIHAARQFLQGDVQHWWHPPTGRGVRTRISDDYLWLPYVVARYVEFTADYSVLDERVPYIEGQELEPHHMESYALPNISAQVGSVYEHCTLALDRALVFGAHGLPLMGGGDWNDGMNEVGKDGKGESVWLGWFLSDALKKFAEVARWKKDDERASRYEAQALRLVQAVDEHAWDGEWYRRAYFDDGTPLGSRDNPECKIDSLSQSWSVITGGGDRERSRTAMQAVRRELVRKEEKIICVLAPPFDNSELEPGYIKGYLAGTRENGGQYTHAAAWVVMATAAEGRGDEAFKLFSLINPINHGRNNAEVQQYRGEPYVAAGDVYSSPTLAGRAGWSWYTGSAGWLYQVGIEHILGLKVRGDCFTIDPVVPSTWKDFSIEFRVGRVLYQIDVRNEFSVERGVASILIDGVRQEGDRIRFLDPESAGERSVRIQVNMGPS